MKTNELLIKKFEQQLFSNLFCHPKNRDLDKKKVQNLGVLDDVKVKNMILIMISLFKFRIREENTFEDDLQIFPPLFDECVCVCVCVCVSER